MRIKILSLVVAAVCLVFTLFVAIDVLFPIRYYGIIKKYCKEYNVQPSVVLSVIWTESKFRPDAVSLAGAQGLMQLMPSTAKWLSSQLGCDEDDLSDPEYNIMLGVYYLSYLKTKFSGDYIFAAYNAGEGNVEKWISAGGEIRFPETRDYVDRINAVNRLYRLRVGN